MPTKAFNETFAYELRSRTLPPVIWKRAFGMKVSSRVFDRLRNVAQANCGMTKLAEETSLGREACTRRSQRRGTRSSGLWKPS